MADIIDTIVVTADYGLYLCTDGTLRKNNAAGEIITDQYADTLKYSEGSWYISNLNFTTSADTALTIEATGKGDASIVLSGANNTVTSLANFGKGIVFNGSILTISEEQTDAALTVNADYSYQGGQRSSLTVSSADLVLNGQASGRNLFLADEDASVMIGSAKTEGIGASFGNIRLTKTESGISSFTSYGNASAVSVINTNGITNQDGGSVQMYSEDGDPLFFNSIDGLYYSDKNYTQSVSVMTSVKKTGLTLSLNPTEITLIADKDTQSRVYYTIDYNGQDVTSKAIVTVNGSSEHFTVTAEDGYITFVGTSITDIPSEISITATYEIGGSIKTATAVYTINSVDAPEIDPDEYTLDLAGKLAPSMTQDAFLPSGGDTGTWTEGTHGAWVANKAGTDHYYVTFTAAGEDEAAGSLTKTAAVTTLTAADAKTCISIDGATFKNISAYSATADPTFTAEGWGTAENGLQEWNGESSTVYFEGAIEKTNSIVATITPDEPIPSVTNTLTLDCTNFFEACEGGILSKEVVLITGAKHIVTLDLTKGGSLTVDGDAGTASLSIADLLTSDVTLTVNGMKVTGIKIFSDGSEGIDTAETKLGANKFKLTGEGWSSDVKYLWQNQYNQHLQSWLGDDLGAGVHINGGTFNNIQKIVLTVEDCIYKVAVNHAWEGTYEGTQVTLDGVTYTYGYDAFASVDAITASAAETAGIYTFAASATSYGDFTAANNAAILTDNAGTVTFDNVTFTKDGAFGQKEAAFTANITITGKLVNTNGYDFSVISSNVTAENATLLAGEANTISLDHASLDVKNTLNVTFENADNKTIEMSSSKLIADKLTKNKLTDVDANIRLTGDNTVQIKTGSVDNVAFAGNENDVALSNSNLVMNSVSFEGTHNDTTLKDSTITIKEDVVLKNQRLHVDNSALDIQSGNKLINGTENGQVIVSGTSTVNAFVSGEASLVLGEKDKTEAVTLKDSTVTADRTAYNTDTLNLENSVFKDVYYGLAQEEYEGKTINLNNSTLNYKQGFGLTDGKITAASSNLNVDFGEIDLYGTTTVDVSGNASINAVFTGETDVNTVTLADKTTLSDTKMTTDYLVLAGDATLTGTADVTSVNDVKVVEGKELKLEAGGSKLTLKTLTNNGTVNGYDATINGDIVNNNTMELVFEKNNDKGGDINGTFTNYGSAIIRGSVTGATDITLHCSVVNEKGSVSIGSGYDPSVTTLTIAGDPQDSGSWTAVTITNKDKMELVGHVNVNGKVTNTGTLKVTDDVEISKKFTNSGNLQLNYDASLSFKTLSNTGTITVYASDTDAAPLSFFDTDWDNTGTITVDMTGKTGLYYKIVDYTGSDDPGMTVDAYNISFKKGTQGDYQFYVVENDLYASKVPLETIEIAFNHDWEGTEVGESVWLNGQEYVYGYTAYSDPEYDEAISPLAKAYVTQYVFGYSDTPYKYDKLNAITLSTVGGNPDKNKLIKMSYLRDGETVLPGTIRDADLEFVGSGFTDEVAMFYISTDMNVENSKIWLDKVTNTDGYVNTPELVVREDATLTVYDGSLIDLSDGGTVVNMGTISVEADSTIKTSKYSNESTGCISIDVPVTADEQSYTIIAADDGTTYDLNKITMSNEGKAKYVIKITDGDLTLVRAHVDLLDEKGSHVDYYMSLNEAVAVAGSGYTFVLIDDVTESGDIMILSDKTLDVSEYTLTGKIFTNVGSVEMDAEGKIIAEKVSNSGAGTITVNMFGAEDYYYELIKCTGSSTDYDYGTYRFAEGYQGNYKFAIYKNNLYAIDFGAYDTTTLKVNAAWNDYAVGAKISGLNNYRYGFNAFDIANDAPNAVTNKTTTIEFYGAESVGDFTLSDKDYELTLKTNGTAKLDIVKIGETNGKYKSAITLDGGIMNTDQVWVYMMSDLLLKNNAQLSVVGTDTNGILTNNGVVTVEYGSTITVENAFANNGFLRVDVSNANSKETKTVIDNNGAAVTYDLSRIAVVYNDGTTKYAVKQYDNDLKVGKAFVELKDASDAHVNYFITVNDGIAAAEEAFTAALIDNTTESESVTVKEGITFDLGSFTYETTKLINKGTITINAVDFATTALANLTLNTIDNTTGTISVDMTGATNIAYHIVKVDAMTEKYFEQLGFEGSNYVFSNNSDNKYSFIALRDGLYAIDRTGLDFTTLKVNAAWQNLNVGDAIEGEDGYYYGINAFGYANDAVSGMLEETTTLSFAGSDTSVLQLSLASDVIIDTTDINAFDDEHKQPAQFDKITLDMVDRPFGDISVTAGSYLKASALENNKGTLNILRDGETTSRIFIDGKVTTSGEILVSSNTAATLTYNGKWTTIKDPTITNSGSVLIDVDYMPLGLTVGGATVIDYYVGEAEGKKQYAKLEDYGIVSIVGNDRDTYKAAVVEGSLVVVNKYYNAVATTHNMVNENLTIKTAATAKTKEDVAFKDKAFAENGSVVITNDGEGSAIIGIVKAQKDVTVTAADGSFETSVGRIEAGMSNDDTFSSVNPEANVTIRTEAPALLKDEASTEGGILVEKITSAGSVDIVHEGANTIELRKSIVVLGEDRNAGKVATDGTAMTIQNINRDSDLTVDADISVANGTMKILNETTGTVKLSDAGDLNVKNATVINTNTGTIDFDRAINATDLIVIENCNISFDETSTIDFGTVMHKAGNGLAIANGPANVINGGIDEDGNTRAATFEVADGAVVINNKGDLKIDLAAENSKVTVSNDSTGYLYSSEIKGKSITIENNALIKNSVITASGTLTLSGTGTIMDSTISAKAIKCSGANHIQLDWNGDSVIKFEKSFSGSLVIDAVDFTGEYPFTDQYGNTVNKYLLIDSAYGIGGDYSNVTIKDDDATNSYTLETIDGDLYVVKSNQTPAIIATVNESSSVYYDELSKTYYVGDYLASDPATLTVNVIDRSGTGIDPESMVYTINGKNETSYENGEVITLKNDEDKETYTYVFKASSQEGEESIPYKDTHTVTYTVDKSGPVIGTIGDADYESNGIFWFKREDDFEEFFVEVTDAGSGVRSVSVECNGITKECELGSSGYIVPIFHAWDTASDTYTITATDNLGNVSTREITIGLDSGSPSINITFEEKMVIAADDEEEEEGGEDSASSNSGSQGASGGLLTGVATELTAEAVKKIVEEALDKKQEEAAGEGGELTTEVWVTISASDKLSGLKEGTLKYKIGDVDKWEDYLGAFKLSEDDLDKEIKVKAEDNVGNEEESSQQLKNPVITIDKENVYSDGAEKWIKLENSSAQITVTVDPFKSENEGESTKITELKYELKYDDVSSGYTTIIGPTDFASSQTFTLCFDLSKEEFQDPEILAAAKAGRKFKYIFNAVAEADEEDGGKNKKSDSYKANDSFSFRFDGIAPTLDDPELVSIQEDGDKKGPTFQSNDLTWWVKKDSTVEIRASANDLESGIDSSSFKLNADQYKDGLKVLVETGRESISASEFFKYKFSVSDNVGNSTSKTTKIGVDGTGPSIGEITLVCDQDESRRQRIYNNVWIAQNVNAYAQTEITDSLSGVNYEYSLLNGVSYSGTNFKIKTDAESDITTYDVVASDNVGNETVVQLQYGVDGTGPVIEEPVILNPDGYKDNFGVKWYKQNAEVTISAKITDEKSGVRTAWLQYNDEDPVVYELDSAVVVHTEEETDIKGDAYTFTARDQVDNYATPVTQMIGIDGTGPTIDPIVLNPVESKQYVDASGIVWYKQGTEVKISADIDDSLSGVKKSLLNGNTYISGEQVVVNTDKETSNAIYVFEAVDNVGNETVETKTVGVDGSGPTIEKPVLTEDGYHDKYDVVWYKKGASVTISADIHDELSGVKSSTLNGKAYTSGSEVTVDTSKETTISGTAYTFASVDNLGNVAKTVTQMIGVDNEGPTIEYRVTAEDYYDETDKISWYKEGATPYVYATITDKLSGVNTGAVTLTITDVKTKEETVQSYTSGEKVKIALDAKGEPESKTYTFTASDNVGNKTTVTVKDLYYDDRNIAVDGTGPDITITVSTKTLDVDLVTFSIAATDTLSGYKDGSIEYKFGENGEWTSYTDGTEFREYGNETLYVRAQDNVGNYGYAEYTVKNFTDDVITYTANTYTLCTESILTVTYKDSDAENYYQGQKVQSGTFSKAIRENGDVNLLAERPADVVTNDKAISDKTVTFHNIYSDKDKTITVVGDLEVNAKKTLSKNELIMKGGSLDVVTKAVFKKVTVAEGENELKGLTLNSTSITINDGAYLKINSNQLAVTSGIVENGGSFEVTGSLNNAAMQKLITFTYGLESGKTVESGYDITKLSFASGKTSVVNVTGGMNCKKGASITVNTKTDVTLNSDLKFNTTGTISVKANAHLDLNGEVTGISQISLSTGTKLSKTEQGYTRAEFENITALNNNFGLTAGAYSIFSVGNITANAAKTNKVSVGGNAVFTANDMSNISTLTLSSGAKDLNKVQQYTQFTASNVTGTAKSNTYSFGAYSKSTVNTIDFVAGNNSMKFGKAAIFTASEVKFGTGKDTLSISTNADINIAKVDFGAGNGTLQIGNESNFVSSEVKFGNGNATLTFGNKSKANITSLELGTGKNTIKICDNAAITIAEGSSATVKTLTIGKNSIAYLSDELAGIAKTNKTSTVVITNDHTDDEQFKAIDTTGTHYGWLGYGIDTRDMLSLNGQHKLSVSSKDDVNVFGSEMSDWEFNESTKLYERQLIGTDVVIELTKDSKNNNVTYMLA